MKSAREAIQRSIYYGDIQTIPWEPGLISHMESLADDFVETEDVVEFWGESDDGRDWRVHVNIRSRAGKVALIVKDLIQQDLANPEGDGYAHHGSARKAVAAWREAAGEAGDLDLVDVIDEMGVRYFAQEYQAIREDAERY